MARHPSSRWRVERREGPAAELQRMAAQDQGPGPVASGVVMLVPTRPALVLGSTQPSETVDRERAEAAGVEVVRRRTGGGAVLVRPGQLLWLDVVVRAGDRVWDHDVARSFHWLGRAWAQALGDLGLDARWHDGPLVAREWSRLVCFAGLGPGEVTVEGRKVVGLGQRRTRDWARFQCAALLRWDPEALVDLLRLEPPERRRAAADLASVAAGLAVPIADLEAALLDRLIQT